jgi:putative membrane protein
VKTVSIRVALIGALAMSGCDPTEGTAAAQEAQPQQPRETPRTRQEQRPRGAQGEQPQTRQQAPQGQTAQQEVPRNLSSAEIAAVLDLVNTAEVREGRLAQTRARSPEVRQFAEQMVRDHTQAQDRGRQLTQQLSITPRQGELTRRMQREGEATMTQLEAAQGEAFDRAYVDAQVREHRQVVAILDANMTNVTERQYREFLETQRRAIDQHRQMAERMLTTLQPRASR